MSSVWMCSDLHIDHQLVVESRCDRNAVIVDAAYRSVEEGEALIARWHNDTLARNWDSVIGKDDVVWVTGDISSGKAPDQINALNWIRARTGRKRLILGNHDGPHPMHRDAHKWSRAYSEVFEHVSTSARIRVPLADGYVTALLSHYPYVGDHSAQDRHTQWRLRDEGIPIIHGHTHSTEKISHSWVNNWVPGGPERGTLQIHVGVDAWDLRPVNISEIAHLIVEAGLRYEDADA